MKSRSALSSSSNTAEGLRLVVSNPPTPVRDVEQIRAQAVRDWDEDRQADRQDCIARLRTLP